MSYTVSGFEKRASECARLAMLTDDEMVGNELLRLRQTYLGIAERLRQQGFQEERRSN